MKDLQKEYYNKWIEQIQENKKLKEIISNYEKQADYNSNFKEELKYTYREMRRLETSLNSLIKNYKIYQQKTNFFNESHVKLIKLFDKYMLLEDNLPNITLNKETQNIILKEVRTILHKEKQQYKVGRIFFTSNCNYAIEQTQKELEKKRKKLF